MSADSTVDVELGIAASFVCEPVGRWLGVWLDALGGATVKPRLRFAGYQQLQQELRQPVAFRGAPPAHATTPLPPVCQPKALTGRLHHAPPHATHHAPPHATHHAPPVSARHPSPAQTTSTTTDHALPTTAHAPRTTITAY